VKTKFTLLLLALILGACSRGIATPQTLPSQIPTDTSPPPTEDISSTQCGYQWAYESLPELTAQFDEAVKALIPNSSSHATAYGENCVGNDGQVIRFLAMETDFYVIVTVETLDDYETFGDWIYDVMQVVDGFPPEDLAGPQPGFVEFRFEKSFSENISFRVPIQGYSEASGGKTGKELFHLFFLRP
jgi:hypothetical protein